MGALNLDKWLDVFSSSFDDDDDDVSNLRSFAFLARGYVRLD